MKLISHRGNTVGSMESWENEPTYIDLAISKGYDVEVDVWKGDMNMLFLGHDSPDYGVDRRFFEERIDKLWVHCKNLEAVSFFFNYNIGKPHKEQIHYFWHQKDDVTLTSKGFIWAYPGKQPIKNSIAVMPEYFGDDISQCYGVCSDEIEKYKE
jgi:hypothetical protein